MSLKLKLIAVGILIGGIAALGSGNSEGSEGPTTSGTTVSGTTPDGIPYSYEVGDSTYDPYAPDYDPTLHGNNELGSACGIFTSC